jgi:hypothetical protein
MVKITRMNRYSPLTLLCLSLCITLGNSPKAVSQPAALNFGRMLPNGNYRFCSEPPRSGTVSPPGEIVGHCFLFRKQGNQVVGKYYDTRTYGEVSVCLSGSLTDRVLAQGLEYIGGIGRQRIPANAAGEQLVNWDKTGILQISGAEPYGKITEGGKPIRYRQAILDLKRLYRLKAGPILPPSRCFSSNS